MDGLDDTSANISKIKKFLSLVDHSFITTNPSALNLSNKNLDNIHFFMTPVDRNIECFDVYKLKPKMIYFMR